MKTLINVRGFRLFWRDSKLGTALTFISTYCELNKANCLVAPTNKDGEILMRTQNVAKFEQEWNQSRQYCMLKDLQKLSVVQTVPLYCLGSCTLVFVCTHENLSVPTCVGYHSPSF